MNINDIVSAARKTALRTALGALLMLGGCAVRIGPTNVGQKPIKAIPSSQLVWVNKRITFSEKMKMTIYPIPFSGITNSQKYSLSNLEYPAGYFAVPNRGIGSLNYLDFHPNYQPQSK